MEQAGDAPNLCYSYVLDLFPSNMGCLAPVSPVFNWLYHPFFFKPASFACEKTTLR